MYLHARARRGPRLRTPPRGGRVQKAHLELAASLPAVFCNNCGHRNPPASNFCSSCGAPLEHGGEDTTITLVPLEQTGEVGDDEISVGLDDLEEDRKSTRLNSSHANISYAVFCLKKKKKEP